MVADGSFMQGCSLCKTLVSRVDMKVAKCKMRNLTKHFKDQVKREQDFIKSKGKTEKLQQQTREFNLQTPENFPKQGQNLSEITSKTAEFIVLDDQLLSGH